MWFIQRKQAGRDPPAALTPDMVPPSLRPKGQDAVSYWPFFPIIFQIVNGAFTRNRIIFFGVNILIEKVSRGFTSSQIFGIIELMAYQCKAA